MLKRTWNFLRPLLILALVAVAAALLARGQGTSSRPADPGAAPGFTLPALDGTPTSLASFRGRPVLLNFWATWCPPCRAELPDLEAIAKDQPHCLQVLGISEGGDSPARLARFVADERITYPMLVDGEDVGRLYGVRTIPHSVLVDAAGKTVRIFDGPLTRAVLDRALSALPGSGRC